jgi:two-component system sensor histidine kinase PhoQ
MKSIKSRMMLTSLIVLVGFMVLTAVALERAIRVRMLEAEEDKLTALMYSVLAAVDRDASGLSITVSDARLFENALFDPGSGLNALLYDKNGEIWRSLSTELDFPEPQINPEQLRFSQQNFGAKHWFQLAFSIRWPNVHDKLSLYKLVLWKDASDYLAQFERFRQTLWLWLLITIALLLLVMWLVMLWSLRPLRQIGEELKAIENNRQHRFDSDYPNEIKPLTQNLNILLQREQHQMQRYRNALDDLAHSLKTPLAVLQGLSEKKDFSGEDRHTLQEQNQRMNQIVTYQLQKAATVGGDSISKKIALNTLVEKTVNALRRIYRDKIITLHLDATRDMELRMDESDLLEILGNLIDNACKYGRKQVRISSSLQDRKIQLIIEDDGAGLNSAQLDQILARGARLDQSREGQGIGLAVVSEIVEAYDIELLFEKSGLGGLTVKLGFKN